LAHTQDDGFHEIQLNGKQLVFLFMTATVVSVGIFLLGVLVGRGVRADRGVAIADASAAAAETLPAPQQPAATPPATPAGSDPRTAAPPPATEDLSYFDRLEKSGQPKEALKAAGEKSASEKAAPEKPSADAGKASAANQTPLKPTVLKAAPDKSAAAKLAPVEANGRAASPPIAPSKEPPPPKEPAAKPAAADTGGAFTVQVAALNARGEADAIAKRLTSKGYAAYVVAPGNGAVMFRVRVGHFKTRHDAEPVFAKLQKEEQFKPWITR
jgi:cell division septation protein DedD